MERLHLEGRAAGGPLRALSPLLLSLSVRLRRIRSRGAGRPLPGRPADAWLHRRWGLERRGLRRAEADRVRARGRDLARRDADPRRVRGELSRLCQSRIRPDLRPWLRVPGCRQEGGGRVSGQHLRDDLGPHGEQQRHAHGLRARASHLPLRADRRVDERIGQARPDRRDRSALHPQHLPRLQGRGHGGPARCAGPRGLHRQLRRHGGRARGGAGPDRGGRGLPHAPGQRGGAGGLPGRLRARRRRCGPLCLRHQSQSERHGARRDPGFGDPRHSRRLPHGGAASEGGGAGTRAAAAGHERWRRRPRDERRARREHPGRSR